MLVICVAGLPSCKKNITEFLDKAPGVDITENTIFSSPAQLEFFITSIYRYGIHSTVAYRDPTLSTTGTVTTQFALSGCSTDEGESEQEFVHTQQWNLGAILPRDIVRLEDVRYYIRWIAIRYVALMVDRIGEVPGLNPTYRDQVIAESKCIRALNYLEMLKRYGGVPIVDKRFAAGEEVSVPRSSVAACVDFMIKDLNEAIPMLPATYASAQAGRITRAAAMALKSKVLLYAASPLYNTGTPYLNMANAEDNKLICYGSLDNNRWKLAADAAKDALDYFNANGYGLIDDQGVDKNYKYAWQFHNNKEILLAEQYAAARTGTSFPWASMYPAVFGGFWNGVSVTHNFVRKYEKRDGTPQTWNTAGGNDLTQKYEQLDYRFRQTVAYNGSFFNNQHPALEIYEGGRHVNLCDGGAWLRKLIPEALQDFSNAQIPHFALFRVNEVHLNYAEAINEFQGPVPAAYTSVNLIRARSGMPPLPAGLSKEQFRQRVMNERDIELAFEDHRFWDIRRWMIAEQNGVMQGDFYGLKIRRISAGVFSYLPYVFEPRVFKRQLYLHPFDLTEVQKGNLVQNPGY